MSSPNPIPPSLNVHASRQPQLYAAQITTYILAVLAIVLRFWARKLMKTKLWWDDWIAAAALSLATGILVINLFWLSQGYGQHFETLQDDYATHFFKNLFTEEILYTLVIYLVKYSILAFYWRIFASSIRIPCYILGGITTCWAIASIAVIVAQCIPISGFWNRRIPAKCGVNDYAFFIGIAVPSILTDAALLLLPLPYTWRLHMTRSQKIALTGIFILGGFVTIMSIVRLTTLVNVDLKSPDLDYKFAYVGVWSITEADIAIVCACLPSLRPIICLIIYKNPDPSAWGSKGNASSRSLKVTPPSASTQSYGEPSNDMYTHHKFMKLPDEASDNSATGQFHATAVAGKRDTYGHEDIEMLPTSRPADGGISVRSDVNVNWAQSQ